MASNTIGDEIKVRFGVAMSDFKSQLGEATKGLDDAIGGMKGMLGKFDDAAANTSGVVDKLGSTVASLASPFNKIIAVVGVLAGVLSGAAFKSGIDESKKLTGEAIKLATALGIDTAAASTLNVALGSVFSDSDTYLGTLSHFQRALKNNEEGMQAMGLKTRDSNGHLRDSQTLMREAGEVSASYKQGIDRNEASMVFFGRSFADASVHMKLTNEVMEEAKAKADALGLTITENNVKATKAYKSATNDLSEVMSALKKVIGDALMPVFTLLSKWLADMGPTLVKGFRWAVAELVSVFWELRAAVVEVWETLGAFLYTITEPLLSFSKALALAFTGEWKAAAKEFEGLGDRISTAWKASMSRINAASTDSKKRVKDLFEDTSGGVMVGPQGGDKTMGALKKPEPDKSRMGEWDAALSEQKAVLEKGFAMQNQFRQMSKQEEKNYWAGILAGENVNATEKIALRKKIADADLAMTKDELENKLTSLQADAAAYRYNFQAKLEIENKVLAMYTEGTKEYQNQRRKITEIERAALQQEQVMKRQTEEANKAIGLGRIQAADEEAKLLLSIGAITQQQYFALQVDLENQRLQLQKESLEKERANLMEAKDKNLEALKKNAIELEALEAEHDARIRDIQRKSILDASKYVTEIWSSVQSGFQQMFQGIANGTIKMGNLFQSVFKFIGQTITKIASEFLSEMLTNYLKSKLAGITTAISQVMSNAAVAGSAAVASTAAIPIVGPFAAPAAGAAAYAEAASFVATIPVARMGMSVPSGVNPIVQIHEEEMVLPKEESNAVRSMTGSGGATHIYINAIDTKGVAQFANDNAPAFARAAQRVVREGFRK